jgi:hypothetical protein
VSQDITSILRENRYLKEQLEYKDWECKEMHDRVKFLEEEVRKLRFYVGEQYDEREEPASG